MALYSYIKEKKTTSRNFVKNFSYLSLFAGTLLLFWAVYPVLSFEIYSRVFLNTNFKSALKEVDKNNILGESSLISNNLRDFTQVKFWFPRKNKDDAVKLKNLPVKEYSLSIPKLSINQAKVLVSGEELDKGLVHYLPNSQPGEIGNVVILGHSTLPQLYNPKDYKTIFTYLPSLDKGDKIIVYYSGINYEYEVYEMFVVKPEETWVLESNVDEPIFTLITCVPPGTYWKRLIVRARLVNFPHN